MSALELSDEAAGDLCQVRAHLVQADGACRFSKRRWLALAKDEVALLKRTVARLEEELVLLVGEGQQAEGD